MADINIRLNIIQRKQFHIQARVLSKVIKLFQTKERSSGICAKNFKAFSGNGSHKILDTLLKLTPKKDEVFYIEKKCMFLTAWKKFAFLGLNFDQCCQRHLQEFFHFFQYE